MQTNINVLVCIHKLNLKSPRTVRFFNEMAFVLVHTHASLCLTYLNLVLKLILYKIHYIGLFGSRLHTIGVWAPKIFTLQLAPSVGKNLSFSKYDG